MFSSRSWRSIPNEDRRQHISVDFAVLINTKNKEIKIQLMNAFDTIYQSLANNEKFAVEVKYLEGAEGVLVTILSTETIKQSNLSEESREIPNIDVFNNPTLLLHSQIPVPRSTIPFSQLIKKQTPVPNLPFPYPLFYMLLLCFDRLHSLILPKEINHFQLYSNKD